MRRWCPFHYEVRQAIDAVVDTGFTRFLTLPPAMVAELGLGYRGVNSVILADGSETTLEVYGVTVLWGRPAKRGRCIPVRYDAPHRDVIAATGTTWTSTSRTAGGSSYGRRE